MDKTKYLSILGAFEKMESNQWIWVRVEKDDAAGSIQEQFFTKNSYRQQVFW